MDVPHGDEKAQDHTVEVGTTEIHIDEQGNLKTADQLGPAGLPDMAPSPAAPLPPLPVVPPPTNLPSPPPVPPAPEEPNHALMSAPPLANADAVEQLEDQPNWSTPYNLSPQDPYENTEAQAPAQSEPKDEVTHGKDIQPPGDLMGPAPLHQARGAVQSAFSGAPFDPLTAGPIQALNAEPLGAEPLHPEPSPPPASVSDTPSLVLPPTPQAPLSTTPLPPPPPLPPAPEIEMAAPPPLPPPLVAAPGVVIPTPTSH